MEDSKIAESGLTNIDVWVRIKPLGETETSVFEDQNSVLLQTLNSYDFDHVFSEVDQNKDIFKRIIVPQLKEKAINGMNMTVLAYGQTSSGKTYTMYGSQTQPGIIALTIRSLIKLSEHWKKNHSIGSKYAITVSYLEIYNERVNDLLDSKKLNLDINTVTENGNKVTVINGLTQETVEDERTILQILSRGEQVRKVSSTDFNEESSRSHTIFQIDLDLIEKWSNGDSLIKSSQINLVDLAGSEALSSSNHERKQEWKNINKSLLALSNVILELSKAKGGSKYISYRTSKLTRILENSLSGNSKTIIIWTINQARKNKIESINTLKFGATAKTVKTKIEMNQYVSKQSIDTDYCKQLEAQNTMLKQQLMRYQNNTSVDDSTPPDDSLAKAANMTKDQIFLTSHIKTIMTKLDKKDVIIDQCKEKIHKLEEEKVMLTEKIKCNPLMRKSIQERLDEIEDNINYFNDSLGKNKENKPPADLSVFKLNMNDYQNDDMLVSKLPNKSRELSQIDEEGEFLQDYMKIWDENIRLKNELQEKEFEIAELKDSWANLLQTVENGLDEYDNNIDKLQQKDEEITKLNEIISKFEQQARVFAPSFIDSSDFMNLDLSNVTSYDQLEWDLKDAIKFIDQLQNDISNLKSENDQLNQDNSKFKNENQTQIEKLEWEIDKLNRLIESKSNKETKLLRDLDELDKYKKSLEIEHEQNTKLRQQISVLQNDLTTNEDFIMKASKYDSLNIDNEYLRSEIAELKKMYLKVESLNTKLSSENLELRKNTHPKTPQIEQDYTLADLSDVMAELKIIIEKIDDCDFVEQEYNCMHSQKKVKLSEYDKAGYTPIKLVKFDYFKLYNNSKKALANIKNLLIDVVQKKGSNLNISHGLHEIYDEILSVKSTAACFNF